MFLLVPGLRPCTGLETLHQLLNHEPHGFSCTVLFDSEGISLDSATANAVLRYYSVFGTLEETEQAYVRKFDRLREFCSEVGLGRRRDLGNVLWNAALLSYAAEFKMKNLQREFVGMLGAGFSPDITTFNIRALAFSRMALF
ncbi:unnamed protein product [Microthlaspi erraticum]|uniref:Uncharacterized protein n=1 Tax=Microthlaspi erraticum TaxID=1685480 RepID=A0A6D2L9U3_9BRAS|nr:unnamed protein product [Microthlaspi erraticum]